LFDLWGISILIFEGPLKTGLVWFGETLLTFKMNISSEPPTLAGEYSTIGFSHGWFTTISSAVGLATELARTSRGPPFHSVDSNSSIKADGRKLKMSEANWALGRKNMNHACFLKPAFEFHQFT